MAQRSDYNYSTQKHYVKSWKNLVKMWQAQKLCDITVCVKEKSFRCHSVVPAAASPFFRRAFAKKQELSCEASTFDKEIIIDFMNADLFSQVLHFMYTAEIRVNEDSARALILAAGRLEMQTMINAILERILTWEQERQTSGLSDSKSKKENGYKADKERSKVPIVRDGFKKGQRKDTAKTNNKRHRFGDLSEEDSDAPGPWHERRPRDKSLTVVGIMDELRLQGDMATLKRVRTFAVRHFAEISTLDSFLNSSVHTLACLLDDERLNVVELQVFLALCKWLEAHQMHMVHAPYLLSKIRLQLLSPAELTEHVEIKDYLMKTKKCRVHILEAFRYHCLQSQKTDLESPYSFETLEEQHPRKGIEEDYVTDDGDFSDDDLIDSKEKTGSSKCPIRPCACVPDYILLSGGIDIKEKFASDSVYRFEEKDNKWYRFAKLPQHRNHHAAIYCKGALYIIGGSDPSLTGPGAEVFPVSSCYKLGLGSLKWCKVDSMSTSRMSLQAAYLDGYIYVVGGQDRKQKVLRGCERYCVTTGKWEAAGSLSTARAGVAICGYNRRLWAIGGFCNRSGVVMDAVEAYKEENADWELMPTLRFPRCFASAAVCKQNLYVLGGAWLDSELEESNFSSVYDMDIYNPVSKLWEGVTALSIGRHDAGIAVLGPRIYIVGGKHCDEGTMKNLDTVECFDVEKDDWVIGIAPLPLPLLGPAVTYTC